MMVPISIWTSQLYLIFFTYIRLATSQEGGFATHGGYLESDGQKAYHTLVSLKPLTAPWEPPADCLIPELQQSNTETNTVTLAISNKSWLKTTTISHASYTFGCGGGTRKTCCPPNYRPDGYYTGTIPVGYLVEQVEQYPMAYTLDKDNEVMTAAIACPEFYVPSSKTSSWGYGFERRRWLWVSGDGKNGGPLTVMCFWYYNNNYEAMQRGITTTEVLDTIGAPGFIVFDAITGITRNKDAVGISATETEPSSTGVRGGVSTGNPRPSRESTVSLGATPLTRTRTTATIPTETGSPGAGSSPDKSDNNAEQELFDDGSTIESGPRPNFPIYIVIGVAIGVGIPLITGIGYAIWRFRKRRVEAGQFKSSTWHLAELGGAREPGINEDRGYGGIQDDRRV